MNLKDLTKEQLAAQLVRAKHIQATALDANAAAAANKQLLEIERELARRAAKNK